MKANHILFLSLLTSSLLFADDIFSIDVKNDTTGDRFTHTTNDIMDVIDTVDEDSISSHFDYKDSHQITANLDFRGLPMSLKFAENSTILELDVPDIEISETFDGGTREESIRLLQDWFKNNNKGNIEKIMRELARVSPVDPIAGNPNSLMATMVEDDFTTGFHKVATRQKGMTDKKFIIIAPVYKSFDIDGKKSDNFVLPLGYSFEVGDNPKEMVTLSLPLSYVSVEGAKSYSAGLGASYSFPVNNEWVLTPSAKYSIVGSKNLGTLAQMVGGSLTSSYTLDLGGRQAISLGNMVGYYSTVKMYDGEYAFDPKIRNTVFRNGLMYSTPSDKIYKNTSMDFFVIDTRYVGTDLFMENYEEIGVSFGFNKEVMNLTAKEDSYEYEDELKLGVSYLTSAKADGFEINFGYSF